MEASESITPHRSLTYFALPVLVAGVAVWAGNIFGSVPPKLLIGAMGIAALLIAGIRTGQLRPLLVGSWVFCLTYNRQYFVFEPVVGHQGAEGPYIVLSDAFLLLMLLQWVYEAAFLKQRAQRPAPSNGILWLLPFIAVSVLSGALAEHPAWSFFEILRLVRIVFVLWYFRNCVKEREWWAAVASVCLGVLAQGVIGTAEVATGRSGVLGILGFGNLESQAPPELREEVFYGWRRATGTMSHPPNLACYFLMGIPVAIAIAFSASRTSFRWMSAIAAIAGLSGLACTLSRWPIALMLVMIPLLVAGLVAMGFLELRKAIGIAIVALFAIMAATIPMLGFVEDRITRDLGRSVDFRVQENETGFAIAKVSPLLGIGPNNYGGYLFRFDPGWEWALQYEDTSIKLLHIRPIASPHDGFLLILAETGVVGLAAFIFYLFGVLLCGIRAISRARGLVRAVLWAVLIGFFGLLLQQAVDFSIWADPLYYMLALFFALFLTAPVGPVHSEAA